MTDAGRTEGASPGGPPPARVARLELARALGGACLAPLRALAFRPRLAATRRAVRADVEGPAAAPVDAPDVPLPQRPLRVLVSCAETSGEIHAANLVRALRDACAARGAPEPRIDAIGGERLRALGVPTFADPVARARSNFEGVLGAVPYYVGVIEDAARHAREVRPDVFAPVDSPALHVPLARAVGRYGVPTVHLVAPQYWGWAPWRVRAYRRAVARALTILPFEPAWYARHGVAVAHVGHPLLDALADVPVTRPDDGEDVLAVLPGSRAGVIRRNLPWMLERVDALRERRPAVRAEVLQGSGEHVALARRLVGDRPWASVRSGDLHGDLARARAAFCVSGTVVTDVLRHRLPAVVVYRLAKRVESWMHRHLFTAPWFASTNLLAGGDVLPEFCFRGDGPRAEVLDALDRAWSDAAWRAACSDGLERAAERLGPPGATRRAAGHVLEVAVRGGRGRSEGME